MTFKAVSLRIAALLSKIILGLVVAVCVLAAFIFWQTDPLNLKAPSDQELIATFHQHRAAFEKLQQMAAEDLPNIEYISATEVNGKITTTRKQEYRKLVTEISRALVLGTDYDTTTRFLFAGGGLLAIGPGWGKGIEYVPGDYHQKGEIVPSLDSARVLPSGHVYLRQIELHWFIFYQRDD